MDRSPAVVGQRIDHCELGQCEVRKVWPDGSITVCAARIRKGSNTNMYRLRQSPHPESWPFWTEPVSGL